MPSSTLARDPTPRHSARRRAAALAHTWVLDETTLNGSITQQWRGLGGGQRFGVGETDAGAETQTCRSIAGLGIRSRMSSVAEHYAKLLAPVYAWMAGGTDAAFAIGESDLAPVVGKPGLAVDLGAGFGMHSVPLARAGWRVVAIDSSPILLDQLAAAAAGLPIVTHCGDLLDFADALAAGERPDLMLCMGDTLTHLESLDQVAALCRRVASQLSASGRFLATFRDYTRLPSGNARFIPVRADEHRVLTCFLEEFDDYVQVHDVLHERAADTWTTNVSSYRKLRLAPDALRQMFSAAGLRAVIEPGPRGMVRLIADA